MLQNGTVVCYVTAHFMEFLRTYILDDRVLDCVTQLLSVQLRYIPIQTETSVAPVSVEVYPRGHLVQ